jgi:biopolymer transport protein TolR
MKSILGVCLMALIISSGVAAQDPTKPELRQGIPVQMPVASDAVAIPDADALNATVITVTADGKLFLGTQPAEESALKNLPGSTVYVKADARVPYQRVLTVLDELRGRSVVLLAGSASKADIGKITPPHGVKLAIGPQ